MLASNDQETPHTEDTHRPPLVPGADVDVVPVAGLHEVVEEGLPVLVGVTARSNPCVDGRSYPQSLR